MRIGKHIGDTLLSHSRPQVLYICEDGAAHAGRTNAARWRLLPERLWCPSRKEVGRHRPYREAVAEIDDQHSLAQHRGIERLGVLGVEPSFEGGLDDLLPQSLCLRRQAAEQPPESTLIDCDNQTFGWPFLKLLFDQGRQDSLINLRGILDDPPRPDRCLPLQLALETKTPRERGAESGFSVARITGQEEKANAFRALHEIVDQNIEPRPNVQLALVRKPRERLLQRRQEIMACLMDVRGVGTLLLRAQRVQILNHRIQGDAHGGEPIMLNQ